MDPKAVLILLAIGFVAGVIVGYGTRGAVSRMRRMRAGKTETDFVRAGLCARPSLSILALFDH
jgi:hypothetical protein